MEWVVETVLPREIQKLVLAIEEKDNQIQVFEFTNEFPSTENSET